MKIQWTLIFTLIFALIVAIFAVVNVEPVRVNFIFSNAEMPMIIVILGSTLLGGIIVGMFGIVRQYKLQRQIKTLQKQIEGEKSKKPANLFEPAEAHKANIPVELTTSLPDEGTTAK